MGFGLALVGVFIVGYVIFVSTVPLWIPVAPDEIQAKIPRSSINIFLHDYPLNIGSLLGVLTLPFLTLFIGIYFIQKNKLNNVCNFLTS